MKKYEFRTLPFKILKAIIKKMLKTEQEYSAEFEKFVTEFNKVYNSDDDRK